MRSGAAPLDLKANVTNLELFKQYSDIADRLIEAANKDQLAECLRILALNVAHYKAKFGDIPEADICAPLESGQIDDETAGMLASSMEQICGVLGTVMGLDQPGTLN